MDIGECGLDDADWFLKEAYQAFLECTGRLLKEEYGITIAIVICSSPSLLPTPINVELATCII